MISTLSAYELPPVGWSRILVKIVREDAAADIWPVPPAGTWINPRGVPYRRVAHLEGMRDPEVAAWVAAHEAPGTMALVTGSGGHTPGQLEDVRPLEVLINTRVGYCEPDLIKAETEAEHYQRTGLRYQGA